MTVRDTAPMSSDPDRTLDQLRELCFALPEVTERLSHGSPSFFIRDKKVLCSFHPHGVHGEHDLSMWAPAPVGVQQQLVEAEPERFYRPPYVGPRGWIGVRLDRDVDWDEIDGILREAYRLVAPKTLVKQLDADDARA
jgi:hypothetical protein